MCGWGEVTGFPHRRWGVEMALRRKVTHVLVRVAMLFAGSAVVARPSSAGIWHTQQWNMAMGNDANNLHWQEKIDIDTYIATLEPPWIAAYQEICRDQYDAIKPWFVAHGYNGFGYWPWSNGTHPQCNGTKLGTAVFVLGVNIPGQTTLIKHSLSPPDGQDFAMVCRTQQSLGFQYFGCAIHTKPSVSEAQIENSFTWWLDSTWKNYHTVIAGDFHRTYPTLGLNEWWYVAHEMHLPALTFTHYNNNTLQFEKIDYSFAGKSKFGQGTPEECIWIPAFSNRLSDHKFCVGNFTI
jgi:hypothetical protein